MYDFTVVGDRKIAFAISALVSPRAARRRISCSRDVSGVQWIFSAARRSSSSFTGAAITSPAATRAAVTLLPWGRTQARTARTSDSPSGSWDVVSCGFDGGLLSGAGLYNHNERSSSAPIHMLDARPRHSGCGRLAAELPNAL